MTNCTHKSFSFPRVNCRAVEASFQGGDVTSDGGVLLLRQADRLLGLSEAVARVLVDQFSASFKRAPKKLIRDFDVTDDSVHGNQERRFF